MSSAYLRPAWIFSWRSWIEANTGLNAANQRMAATMEKFTTWASTAGTVTPKSPAIFVTVSDRPDEGAAATALVVASANTMRDESITKSGEVNWAAAPGEPAPLKQS